MSTFLCMLTFFRSWLWLVLLAAVLGWAIWVFSKIVLQHMSPSELTFWRFLFAFVSMIPFFLYEKKEVVSQKNFLKAVWISLFWTANVVLFAFWIKYTTAMIGQILYVLVPIILLFLQRIFFKQGFQRAILPGILLWLAWAVLVILLPVIYWEQALLSGTLEGNFLIVWAVISFSFYMLFSQNIYKHFTPLHYNMIYITTTFICLTVYFLFLSPEEISYTYPWTVWAMLFYIWVIATTLYYTLYQILIKYSWAVYASLIQYIQPIAVVWRAILLLGEQLSVLFLVWVALSLYWVYSIDQAKTKNPKESS